MSATTKSAPCRLNASTGQGAPLLSSRSRRIALRSRPVMSGFLLRAREAELLLERVLHAQAALLGAVDEEQPAEGPERLTAEVVRALLVQQGDGPPGSGELGGGDEAGEARPDDQDVGRGQRNETCSVGTVPAVRPGAVS